MTTPRPDPASDEPWRRPDSGDGSTPDNPTDQHPAGTIGRPLGAPGPASTPAPTNTSGPASTSPPSGTAGYGGPPPTTAPPPGWRPPVHLRPAPPRRLPAQDMATLDAQEQRAQRVTWGVGAVAAAVLLILVCLLCTRALF
ncbi:hypothetical protein ACQPYA_03530 [Micromonospora sp. CA-263727]|uniref:hypothetical protein n=1 Tax=Micromonospora sp. CA-263727 TaxID=3239967 RepID=UPI003D92BBD9